MKGRGKTEWERKGGQGERGRRAEGRIKTRVSHAGPESTQRLLWAAVKVVNRGHDLESNDNKGLDRIDGFTSPSSVVFWCGGGRWIALVGRPGKSASDQARMICL